MSTCLLIIRDGRDEIHERAIASLGENLPHTEHCIIVNDCDHEFGFAGAIQAGWRQVLETKAEFVFHFEADFLFNATVPLSRMANLLIRHPHLVQVSLKRQPWNAEEIAAGGIVELNPDDFTERTDTLEFWTEHRQYWSTNPSLYRTSICGLGWPQKDRSEGRFTHRLLEDPVLRFAIWGRKFDPPMVEHIGKERIGVGY